MTMCMYKKGDVSFNLMFAVSIETVTLCSHVMSVMSVSKYCNNSEGQIQNFV